MTCHFCQRWECQCPLRVRAVKNHGLSPLAEVWKSLCVTSVSWHYLLNVSILCKYMKEIGILFTPKSVIWSTPYIGIGCLKFHPISDIWKKSPISIWYWYRYWYYAIPGPHGMHLTTSTRCIAWLLKVFVSCRAYKTQPLTLSQTHKNMNTLL